MVVQQALARVRDERFQTAEEFGRALAEATTPASAASVAATLRSFDAGAIASRRAHIQRILSGLEDPIVSAPPTVRTAPVAVPRARRRGLTVLAVAVPATAIAVLGMAASVGGGRLASVLGAARDA